MRKNNDHRRQEVQQIVKNAYCRPVEFEGDVVFEDVVITPSGVETEAEEETEDLYTITFLPDGTAQTAVVQIGNGTIHYTISITAATGRARMSFGTAENAKTATPDLEMES